MLNLVAILKDIFFCSELRDEAVISVRPVDLEDALLCLFFTAAAYVVLSRMRRCSYRAVRLQRTLC